MMRRSLAIALLSAVFAGGCVSVTVHEGQQMEQASGLQRIASSQDVATTVAALRSALESRGITVFAEIDHAAAAREAGLEMPPTRVLLFGNPKGGTPLMEKHPDLALDLPLRVLVRQGADGKAECCGIPPRRWSATSACNPAAWTACSHCRRWCAVRWKVWATEPAPSVIGAC